jgi:osmotically-inducible protein OsmY
MRRQTELTLVAALAFAGAFIACKETPATERAAEQARKAGEETSAALERAGEQVKEGAAELGERAQPLLEEAAVTARVKAKLAADPEVSAYAIDVDTVGQVVTLSGRVESEAESAEAEKLARNTEGVSQVVNRLTVGGAPPPDVSPTPPQI